MSFVKNPEIQQLSLSDSASCLTSREYRFLENSWATYFSREIFPLIDEDMFAVLYSGNDASRPNTLVNVLFGAAVLQELNCLTDEEINQQFVLIDPQPQEKIRPQGNHEEQIVDQTLPYFHENASPRPRTA